MLNPISHSQINVQRQTFWHPWSKYPIYVNSFECKRENFTLQMQWEPWEFWSESICDCKRSSGTFDAFEVVVHCSNVT